MAITSRVEEVTPEKAEKWLAKNIHNRPLREGTVNRYASAMMRGEWVLNNNAITFNANGDLVDGQHRLQAVIVVGAYAEDFKIDMLVMRNADMGMQEVIDIGVRRSLQDLLFLRGYENKKTLATTITWAMRLDTDYYGDPRVAMSRRPTNQQALEYIEMYPELAGIARDYAMRLRPITSKRELFMALYFHLGYVDADGAQTFWEKLITGVDNVEESPILAIRRLMILDKAGNKRSIQVYSDRSVYLAGLFNKAWNYWQLGDYGHRLRWASGGRQTEAFPRPLSLEALTDPNSEVAKRMKAEPKADPAEIEVEAE